MVAHPGRPQDASSDRTKELAGFHKVISEQLNARLAESPRFFAALVVTSTAYGFVLWKYSEVGKGLFLIASFVAYASVIWSVWYLAALGYAFRYLQNSQHRIEDDLGWSLYRNRTTGIPQDDDGFVAQTFWLLPGIYHAHAAGLTILLCTITGAFAWRWFWSNNPCGAILTAVLGAGLSVMVVFAINRFYFFRFKAKRLRTRWEFDEGTT